jgi:NADH-dependent peroxiredoxin subunit F
VTVELESGAQLRSRTVILSTGARWRSMDVPGEQEYRNKGVTYCPHCDGPLFKGKRVAVIGGGNSGAEAAIDLAGVVAHVTLIEFDPQLRADAVLQRQAQQLAQRRHLRELPHHRGGGRRRGGHRPALRGPHHRRTARPRPRGIFVQIGLLPNTEWLQGAVELSPRGEVEIDDRGQTSVPGVFAAGDCTTVPYKQIVIAMGAGATASLSAFDHLIRTSAPVPEAAGV